MRNFSPEYKDHAPAGEYYELAADILRNNPAEQAKFALNLIWADSIIALLPSMRPPIVCSIRHCRFYAQMLPDKLDKYVDASVALCRNYGFTKEYGKALEILTKAEKLLPTGDKSDKMGEILRSEAVSYTDKNNMQKQQQTTNRLQTFTKFFPAVM